MLTHLQIRDFAIIDAAELELGDGLTALTGETGAGKSILVDAVLLAIGGRGGPDVVRHGAERAEITATFDIRRNAAARAWLEEQSLEHDGEVMLRRQIGADGRSRAYVNGQAQPVNQVRALGERLLDIHGQQEFLTLVRPDTQRALLDAHGGHAALLAPVARLAHEYRAVEAELHDLALAAAERDARLELLSYQVQELEALALEAGEPEALAAEAQRLANRGRLATGAEAALALLYEGDGEDAHARTGKALAQLRAGLELDARLQPVAALIGEALIPLKEAGRELAAYLESLEVDPRRQEAVETRMASIEQLARKHRVAAAELPGQLAALRLELETLERAGTTLAELEARRTALGREYRAAAATLSGARRRAAGELGKAVTALMRGLGMPGGSFVVEVAALPEAVVDPRGADTIEFLVSANPGQPPKPIARVASGGELSRISLAVQVAAARESDGPTCMIFDEVDAGVGGAVAEMVGRELHALGRRGQVLCVTHLPQVASQADQHVRVAKLSDGRSSRTVLTPLGADERVEELARMLAGVDVTAAAREHAREMLSKPKGSEARPAGRKRRPS
ncbi:MAG: DNA repair protein RecN [Proteobacteria bacterium]|nr:DNA repair protein RecN [Pseudomonadota bacterium]